MVLITEYRIPMPFTLDEYKRGQVYTTIQASLKESQGEDRIEVVENEPYDDNTEMPSGSTSGQYTSKIYNLVSRFPFFIRALAPKDAMILNENSWNSFPFCRTIVTNPRMKDDFFIKIDSIHCEGCLNEENAHQLSPDLLRKREVKVIDIANDPLPKNWALQSPKEFKSEETDLGPLGEDWMRTVEPVMTCYKLVTVKFKWFGLQNRVESFIMKTEKKLFTSFHMQMFVWMDEWIGLSTDQLLLMEREGENQLLHPSRKLSRYQTSAYTVK